MKKTLLFLFMFVGIWSFGFSQSCGTVSLIGEFNGWSDDYLMVRKLTNVDEWHVILTVGEADDPDANGVVEMKFRENKDWAVNWGSDGFPTGTATLDGANIPVTYGTWIVRFNCATGDYEFEATCDEISMIGEFNGWAADHEMHRMHGNANQWYGYISLVDTALTGADSVTELKFRAGADWGMNWGGEGFPTGTGTLDGPNINVPWGHYKVDFNCETGEYAFTSTCGNIALIGEFNGWADDYWMSRSKTNPDEWHVVLNLNDEMDGDANGIIELKFRQNSDWGVNWGSDEFPTGTATQDGANIPVPLDETGLTTDYAVTFNCATGEYSFVATSGQIAMIGAFNGWNGDVNMTRSMDNPNLWTLKRSWAVDSEVKFRENADWTENWGSAAWPSGTGEPNGSNIPLVAGQYDITFDYETKAYNFTDITGTIPGEISMVGDFNNWGADNSDVFLAMDPMFPNLFTIEYSFTSATLMYFRIDAQAITAETIWGGVFPCGTATHDLAAQFDVPGGKYYITFDANSGDFCFNRLGNSVTAPEVFAINVDGVLSEADWNLDQNVSNIVDGAANDDLNTVNFGVTWNADNLFVGVDVVDAVVADGDIVHVFVDGNKSGGDYDDADVHFTINGAGVYTLITGPTGGIDIANGASTTADGYQVEAGIPWAALGVTPETGAQIGFDIIVGDDDGNGVDYMVAWNGGLQNLENTSSFGDLNFGVLSCGCISVYNETFGDVTLQNPTDMPTTYVGTYELFDNYEMVFRKDMDGTVTWGANSWNTGVAVLGGANIPGETGRYRITFDCLTGEYSFVATGTEGIAMAQYTDTPPVIDGDLSEYSLDYASDVLVDGSDVNNTVSWGADWDLDNLYLGVKVVDAIVEGSGNPWENDAIEFYIDGNNDKDGTYDGDFDTQLIMHYAGGDTMWIKADGVQLEEDQYTTKWAAQGDGYIIEVRLAWEIFSFAAGKGRTIGFSLGNNDSDNGLGRDNQTVWYGTASNWSNTGDLGDLQLAGGPWNTVPENVLYNDHIVLYPNPTTADVTLAAIGDVFEGTTTIYVADITGRIVTTISENLNTNGQVTIATSNYESGIYFINVISDNGAKAVKKLIVR